MEIKKKCFSKYIKGNDITQLKLNPKANVNRQQCQQLCEKKSQWVLENGLQSNGHNGCCEYQVDHKACYWQDHVEILEANDQRYGTLCTTRNDICLLIISLSQF